jgi:hypothetical protein
LRSKRWHPVGAGCHHGPASLLINQLDSCNYTQLRHRLPPGWSAIRRIFKGRLHSLKRNPTEQTSADPPDGTDTTPGWDSRLALQQIDPLANSQQFNRP